MGRSFLRPWEILLLFCAGVENPAGGPKAGWIIGIQWQQPPTTNNKNKRQRQFRVCGSKFRVVVCDCYVQGSFGSRQPRGRLSLALRRPPGTTPPPTMCGWRGAGHAARCRCIPLQVGAAHSSRFASVRLYLRKQLRDRLDGNPMTPSLCPTCRCFLRIIVSEARHVCPEDSGLDMIWVSFSRLDLLLFSRRTSLIYGFTALLLYLI